MGSGEWGASGHRCVLSQGMGERWFSQDIQLGQGGKATLIELRLLCIPHPETVGEEGLPGPARKEGGDKVQESQEDCQNHMLSF